MPDAWMMIALVPVLIAVNAFFVAAEYAVVATRPMHLDALRRAGRAAAADAMDTLKRHAAATIGTIQVCITTTNLLLGWLGEPAMTYLLTRALGGLAAPIPPALFKAGSVAVAFLIVTLATVVLSELLPKALTLRYAMPVAAFTARPVLAVARAVRPLVWVMNQLANLVTVPLGLGRVDRPHAHRVTTAEIRLLTTEAAEEGELTPRERSVILSALTLADRTVSRVMVPRVRVRYLDLKWTMDENRAVINERLYSRLPLCNGGMDHVLGIVHVKEFLSAYHAAGDVTVLALIAREPVFVPQTQPLDKLLTLFVETRSQMAIALDEYGGVAGIVTLRDAVDSLLGGDTPATTEPATGAPAASAPGGEPPPAPWPFVVPGDTPLDDIAARLDRHDWCARAAAATVSGLIQNELGRFPAVGETLDVDGVRLEVLEADDRRAVRVRVTVIPTV